MANENKDTKASESKPNEQEQDQENKEQKEKPKKPQKLFRVKFNKSYTPYVQGEIAGLEQDIADDLMEKGICSKA